MNDLQVIRHDGISVVDSREVAVMVEKDHAHLLRDIQVYIETLVKSENPDLDYQNFFIPSNYKVEGNNKTYPNYFLTRKGCDMVANKMTGEKGVLFTAAYVTKFEEMENQLSKPKQTIPVQNEAQRLRAEAMLLNAKTRQAKVIKDTALDFQNKLSNESIQLLIGGITEILMGKSLLPLPTVEKTYSATEIGKELGVSSARIGKIANVNNLKTEEYGITVLDKSPHSNKQVSAFRYNKRGYERLREPIEGQALGR